MYRGFIVAILAGFAIAEWRGIDFFPAAAVAARPSSVRSSGGYRSFYTGSPGYRGGK